MKTSERTNAKIYNNEEYMKHQLIYKVALKSTLFYCCINTVYCQLTVIIFGGYTRV